MKHGTNACYRVDRCRCELCREAATKHERNRRRLALYGQSKFVPAEPVRARIKRLMALGMSQDEIARAAGLNDARISDLMTGHWRTGRPLTRMKRENAEAIMAVNHRHILPGTVIDTDAREMVLDLMAMGYSAAWIAQRLGMSYQGRGAMLRKRHRAGTYAKLRALYRNTKSPAPVSPQASRSRNFALQSRRRRAA